MTTLDILQLSDRERASVCESAYLGVREKLCEYQEAAVKAGYDDLETALALVQKKKGRRSVVWGRPDMPGDGGEALEMLLNAFQHIEKIAPAWPKPEAEPTASQTQLYEDAYHGVKVRINSLQVTARALGYNGVAEALASLDPKSPPKVKSNRRSRANGNEAKANAPQASADAKAAQRAKSASNDAKPPKGGNSYQPHNPNLTGLHKDAARLLASGQSVKATAKAVGRSTSTIHLWKKWAAFLEEIESQREQINGG